MAKHVPSYLQRQVLEGQGDVEAQKTELMLCQIEAIEAQTKVLERIAGNDAADGQGFRKLLEACRTALVLCQDCDPTAAAHALHSALDDAGAL